MPRAAYQQGAQLARERFLGGASAHPPGGASRFTELLGAEAPHAAPKEPRPKRLEREVLWGAPASHEAGGVSNRDPSLAYGGA